MMTFFSLSEMPQGLAVIVALMLGDPNAQPFLEQLCFIEMLLDLLKLIEQRFGGVERHFVEFQNVFRELSRSGHSPNGFCASMDRYAQPQAQVVIQNVLHNHLIAGCKVRQLVCQRAST